MPSSNLRFLSQGVAAATQNRHLPFTVALLPGVRLVPVAGFAGGMGGAPSAGCGRVLVRPAAPDATPRAAAAPIDSRKVLRVVRMMLYLQFRGNLPQL